jgi:hypothetical protein
MQTPHTTTSPRPVQSRWELHDGRLRLRWALGPGGAGGRQPGGMSFGEARDFLLLHGGGGARPGAWRDGRLGPLRPSGGRLDGAYFHEVMAAVAAVAPHLRDEDRTLVAALWDLCELARRWGQEPDAMRRRNGLDSDASASAVAGRLQAISDAVLRGC